MEYGHEIQWAAEKLNSILHFKMNIYVILVIIISETAFIPLIILAVTLSLRNISALIPLIIHAVTLSLRNISALILLIVLPVTLSLRNISAPANKNSTHPSNPPLVFGKRLTLSSSCQQCSGLFQVNQGFCAQRTAALFALTLPYNQITP